MNVFWTETALDDLEAVEAYIGRRSPQYARGVVARIFDGTDQLSTQPLLGPVVSGYEEEGLRELFVNPYRVAGDQVEIITVVHAARRLPKGLGGTY